MGATTPRTRRSPGTALLLTVWGLAALGAGSLLVLPAIHQEGAADPDPEMTDSQGPVEVDSPEADGVIEDRLRRILGTAGRFDGLEVEVREGLVFLAGSTTERDFRDWATGVARRTEDVVAVVNQIEVRGSPIRWSDVLENLLFLAIAYALALPVAWDRERAGRSAGLRTFPLVGVASCAYMLIAHSVFDGDSEKARVMYGIMTGIGFIGCGAIIKDKGGVQGTATAASIWNTAAIGVAVSFSRFEIAIVLCLVNFFALYVIKRVKERADEEDGGE